MGKLRKRKNADRADRTKTPKMRTKRKRVESHEVINNILVDRDELSKHVHQITVKQAQFIFQDRYRTSDGNLFSLQAGINQMLLDAKSSPEQENLFSVSTEHKGGEQELDKTLKQ